MHKITDEYAAGFFDGEGTVYAAVRFNNFRPSPTVHACISNTDIRPLLLFKQRWGGSIHTKKKHERWRLQHQWVLCARMARPFLKAILPHIIIKREVVEVGLEMCSLMALPHRDRVDYSQRVFRNGRYWVSPKVRPEFMAKISRLYGRIRELNSRDAPMNATRRFDPKTDLYALTPTITPNVP